MINKQRDNPSTEYCIDMQIVQMVCTLEEDKLVTFHISDEALSDLTFLILRNNTSPEQKIQLNGHK